MEKEFETRYKNNIAIVDLKDDLSLESIELFGAELLRLCRDGHRQIAINFSSTRYICSSFIGELVRGYNFASSAGGDIRLYGLNNFVMKVFEISCLPKIIKIFDTEEEALDSYGIQEK